MPARNAKERVELSRLGAVIRWHPEDEPTARARFNAARAHARLEEAAEAVAASNRKLQELGVVVEP